MKLDLTHDEAAFLLCAVTDLDTSSPAYNFPQYKDIQKKLGDTLRGICWAFHNDELKEKETARLQIEVACKRWPDLLKELNHPKKNWSDEMSSLDPKGHKWNNRFDEP